jgi:hypothetical protein
MSVRPVAVRPSGARASASTPPTGAVPHPSISYGAPPPEHGYWARWWQRKRMRIFVSIGMLVLLLLFQLLTN